MTDLRTLGWPHSNQRNFWNILKSRIIKSSHHNMHSTHIQSLRHTHTHTHRHRHTHTHTHTLHITELLLTPCLDKIYTQNLHPGKNQLLSPTAHPSPQQTILLIR